MALGGLINRIMRSKEITTCTKSCVVSRQRLVESCLAAVARFLHAPFRAGKPGNSNTF